MTVNIKLTLQYDGTEFNGWQTQAGQIGIRTVQSELKKAIETIVKEPVTVVGSGRTDAGVHARGQVACFHTSKPIPENSWPAALNSVLPEDIRIVDAREVPPGFHPQFNAVKKMYCYYILNRECPDVFLRRYCLHWARPLEFESMDTAARKLKGTRNFKSFCASGSEVSTFERTVYQSQVFPWGDLLVFRITADGFLYKMVRNIVGSLLEIGKGKQDPEWMDWVLEARDRRQAGPVAPARGLVLEKVWYS